MWSLSLRDQLLHRLEITSELCLHLHTREDLAFVYDPIFLEARAKTYILDWGSKLINESLESYIDKIKKPFHTFVFPVEKVLILALFVLFI